MSSPDEASGKSPKKRKLSRSPNKIELKNEHLDHLPAMVSQVCFVLLIKQCPVMSVRISP